MSLAPGPGPGFWMVSAPAEYFPSSPSCSLGNFSFFTGKFLALSLPRLLLSSTLTPVGKCSQPTVPGLPSSHGFLTMAPTPLILTLSMTSPTSLSTCSAQMEAWRLEVEIPGINPALPLTTCSVIAPSEPCLEFFPCGTVKPDKKAEL